MSDQQATEKEAAKWLRGNAEKCCQCTDGHHRQQYAYGTEDDVRISRDTARALADLLDVIGAWVDEFGGLPESGEMEIVGRRARFVANGVLTGSVTSPESSAR